jgi:hypothetical protein
MRAIQDLKIMDVFIHGRNTTIYTETGRRMRQLDEHTPHEKCNVAAQRGLFSIYGQDG